MIDKEQLLKKADILKKVGIILKSEFVGLDDVIDKVINQIEPWFLFPGGQFRPQIINLFGMTGTGKTSLVNRLFKLLEIKSVIQYDTGEWVDKSDYNLSAVISSQFRKIKNEDDRPVFVFDEFQLGRTLDEQGNSIDRPNLRVFWDLIDNGMVTINEDNWQSTELQTLYNKLHLLIENGVKVKDGAVVEKMKEWEVYFEKETDEDKITKIEKTYVSDAFIPPQYIYILFDLVDNVFLSEMELKKYIISLSNEKEILKFLEEILVKMTKPVTYDFSDSIIFVIGNLDDAYDMSHEMSADVNADMMYEYTKKITISDIKESLSNLYRLEQISRLGNNFIIYKSFNCDTYKQLIDLELAKINKKIIEKFDFSVEFSEKTKDLIYKEGVFPSQGVRPVFSTITTLIETKIGKIIIDLIKDDITPEKIYWDTNDEKTEFIISITDKKYFYKFDLLVDNHRTSKSDDIQALVGVHESGHVICDIYALNICPTVAVSKTVEPGGFTLRDLPEFRSKKLLLAELVSILGGYSAEKLIFGDENLTSGSYSDLESVTELALKFVKEFGMHKLPIQYKKSNYRISDQYVDDLGLDKIVEEIISDAQQIAINLLKENMTLLLKMIRLKLFELQKT